MPKSLPAAAEPAQSLFGRIAARFPAYSWYLEGRPWLTVKRFINLIYLQAKRRFGYDYSFTIPADSSVPIDIFMPTLEKDAEVLQKAIDYARQNILHPITNIYIVGSGKSELLKSIAKKKGCIFVDETSILSIAKKDVNYTWHGYNKNGWIFKMLLNLSADSVCTERHILVVDSDTLFIAPQIFLYKNRPLFNLSDEYHQPYFDANANIVGVTHRICRSFITHYMLFDAEVLKDLRARIAERWNEPWDQAVINHLDRSTAMAFADYECYGDFYLATRPGKYYLNYWSNVSHQIDQFEHLEEWASREKAANMHRSLSFHTYLKTATKAHEQ